MAHKIDITKAPVVNGAGYPSPYDVPCQQRSRMPLGDGAGLTQFGVNLCRLPPETWSSQRHWHTHEDELVYVLEGEVVLVTDDDEEVLHAGDCAGFRAGEPNGHQFQNRSGADVVLLEIGTRVAADTAHYPDIDLRLVAGHFQHTDGTPYPAKARPT
jgi:uncharacterized cupin superfamily protein